MAVPRTQPCVSSPGASSAVQADSTAIAAAQSDHAVRAAARQGSFIVDAGCSGRLFPALFPAVRRAVVRAVPWLFEETLRSDTLAKGPG
jgi:hypothetical protein